MGLIVPFGVVTHRLALDQCGVGPVDVWPPLTLMHRAGGAHDENGGPVDVGIVNRHLSVKHPDQVM